MSVVFPAALVDLDNHRERLAQQARGPGQIGGKFVSLFPGDAGRVEGLADFA